MSAYADRLHDAVRKKGTPALVGLDPQFDQLPQAIITAARQQHAPDELAVKAASFEQFCMTIIDVVAPRVPAVKPQAAFFEELGPAGMSVLARIIRYARDAGLIVILDGKRGDIASTAEAYARGYIAGSDPDAAPWGADAITVNPFLGADTLDPFISVAEARGGGIYVLVRTSNPGAGTLQDLRAPVGETGESLPVYEHLADVVERRSAQTCEPRHFGCVGAVVGATWPRELNLLRKRMPHVPLLVPGYGSQGAGAADVAGAFRPDGLGALINSSRAINFAYNREPYKNQYGPGDWPKAVEAATRDMIAELAEKTPAGKLRQW